MAYILREHWAKLQYNVSINDALNNYGDASNTTQLSNTVSKYSGATIHDSFDESARFNYTAHVEYQFWNPESDKLPFKVGSVQTKSSNVFNVSAGVWFQTTARLKSGATVSTVGQVKGLTSFAEVE